MTPNDPKNPKDAPEAHAARASSPAPAPEPPRQRKGTIIVAPGKTINLGEGKVLRPRTVIRAGDRGITDTNIDEWLRDGTVVEVNTGDDVDDAEVRTRPRSPAVPSKEIELKGSQGKGDLLAPPDPRTGAPHGRAEGKWAYDPDSLVGQSLTQLNSLVAGIDSSVPPFDTKEEAIAQLSQDFRSHRGGPRARVG
jgi:hypothetical protein